MIKSLKPGYLDPSEHQQSGSIKLPTIAMEGKNDS